MRRFICQAYDARGGYNVVLVQILIIGIVVSYLYVNSGGGGEPKLESIRMLEYIKFEHKPSSL